MKKIKEVAGFIKDEISGAVLNNDLKSLSAYKKRKASMKKIEVVEERINNMEVDLVEIKSLLHQIIRKIDRI